MAHILIFEDDESLVELMSEGLKADGHEVTATLDADDAFFRIAGGSVDLAIIDIFIRKDGSPSADGGVLLLARLRNEARKEQDFSGRRVPLIMISGGFRKSRLPEDLDEYAYRFGADVFLPKPFAHEQLSSQIERLLNRGIFD